MEPTLIPTGTEGYRDIWLVFVLPAILFWAGIFLGKPKLAATAFVSGMIGLGLALPIEALAHWLGVQDTQAVFIISFHLCTAISILLIVVFVHRKSTVARGGS
jgi:hypothetical protein